MVPPPKQEITKETTQETKPKKRKIIIVKKRRIVKKKPTESNQPETTSTSASKPEPKLTIEELKKAYLQNLNEKERVAMEIAKDHLKTSFDLEKCIDFKNWSSKK